MKRTLRPMIVAFVLLVAVIAALGASSPSWSSRLLTAFALGLCAWLFASVKRSLVEPLSKLVERLPQGGDLVRNLEQLAAQADTVAALESSAALLQQSVDALSASMQFHQHSLQQQAVSLEQLADRMRVITESSDAAAERASAVVSVTENANEIVQVGEQNIEQAIEKNFVVLTDLHSQAHEIASRIVDLNERTQQIEEITLTVKDLADRSNLLAINAAIEAGRSGEHGLGFAVVADEMRTLANQSISATNAVGKILNDLRQHTQQAVDLTVRGAERVDVGMSQLKTSGENMRELSAIVRDNAFILREMAALVGDQNQGIHSTYSGMTDLTRSMQESLERVQSAARSVEELRKTSASVAGSLKRRRRE
jgi:methyl-accepting chemotaxis protein